MKVKSFIILSIPRIKKKKDCTIIRWRLEALMNILKDRGNLNFLITNDGD